MVVHRAVNTGYVGSSPTSPAKKLSIKKYCELFAEIKNDRKNLCSSIQH